MIYFLLYCGVFPLEPGCAIGVLLLHFSSGHRRSNVRLQICLGGVIPIQPLRESHYFCLAPSAPVLRGGISLKSWLYSFGLYYTMDYCSITIKNTIILYNMLYRAENFFHTCYSKLQIQTFSGLHLSQNDFFLTECWLGFFCYLDIAVNLVALCTDLTYTAFSAKIDTQLHNSAVAVVSVDIFIKLH